MTVYLWDCEGSLVAFGVDAIRVSRAVGSRFLKDMATGFHYTEVGWESLSGVLAALRKAGYKPIAVREEEQVSA